MVGVSVGVRVGVAVGVFVGSGVPSEATTSPTELPVRFQDESTCDEALAPEFDAIERGEPLLLTRVAADQLVYGLLASR